MTTPPPLAGDGTPRGANHVQHLLSAYVDDALQPDVASAVADHLTACAECSAAYDAMLTTVATLRKTLVRYPAPDLLRQGRRAALRDAVQQDIAQSTADHGSLEGALGANDDTRGPEGERPIPSQVEPERTNARRVRPTWLWRAAAAMTLVVLSSGATVIATNARRGSERVHDEVLASHIRSLMPDHLTDVRSSDQHNVKPWFNGRLDLSPAVPRLEEQGFPLLGGRLDYVAGRPVAVVVYGRRQHVINVYSWPTTDGQSGVSTTVSRGYHALRWRDAGVEHWAVSDLNVTELEQFVGLLRQS